MKLSKDFYAFFLFSVTMLSFATAQTSRSSDFPEFFVIAHRGARGAMPENSIPAMRKAIDQGANTLELDIHISKDNKVVVYHDASLNPDYTTAANGEEIPKEKRKDYTLYKMNYEEIRKFDIGSKYYATFPQQQRLATYAPLLSELIDSVEAYTKEQKVPPVYYLVEIKSNEKTDGIEQPAPEEYMRIMMEVLNKKGLGKRLLIQSFDMRPLKVLHEKYTGLSLGFLTSDKTKTFGENLGLLGFTPFFYNPNYLLVTDQMIKECHSKKIKITPWTVNEKTDIQRLKNMGVDGIISDYPDRVSGQN
jgi:glycerophosphoryl diester phosphodiesterase